MDTALSGAGFEGRAKALPIKRGCLRQSGVGRMRSARTKSWAPNRNGGRHCCQPPLRRAKDLPVFVTWSPENPKAPMNPLSILAHQLRRRFRSGISLFREARLTYPTTWPEGSLVVRSAWPGWNRNPNQNHPMFRGPSWDEPSRVPLRSPRFRGIPGAASHNRKNISSGASSRLAPKRTRELSPIACRRRSDLWSPAAPFRVVADPSGEAGTAVPIT